MPRRFCSEESLKCFKGIVCFPAECWGKDIIGRKQYHRGEVKNARYDKKNLQIQQNGSTSILLYSSKYVYFSPLKAHPKEFLLLKDKYYNWKELLIFTLGIDGKFSCFPQMISYLKLKVSNTNTNRFIILFK